MELGVGLDSHSAIKGSGFTYTVKVNLFTSSKCSLLCKKALRYLGAWRACRNLSVSVAGVKLGKQASVAPELRMWS